MSLPHATSWLIHNLVSNHQLKANEVPLHSPEAGDYTPMTNKYPVQLSDILAQIGHAHDTTAPSAPISAATYRLTMI